MSSSAFITKEPSELNEWMGKALQKAEDSLRKAEVPVGCLFVYENEVIASGNNTVNETRNATRHAEINCIDKVLEYCRERHLDYHEIFRKIDVVVTVEPCIMCAAALHQLRIRSIVYGCPNDRFGGCASVFEVPKISDAKIDITSNVRAEEAMILLKNFYKGTNPNAPECKVKKKKPFNPQNPAQKIDAEDKKDGEETKEGEKVMNEEELKSEDSTEKSDESGEKSDESEEKSDESVEKSDESVEKSYESAEKSDEKPKTNDFEYSEEEKIKEYKKDES